MSVWDVNAVSGLDPAVAPFWYLIEFGRPRFTRLMQGLAPEQLAARPAGFSNSIAALVNHVAGAEIHFAHRVMGTEMPAELKAKYMMDQPNASPLPQPEGETVESLQAKLDQALGFVREALSGVKAADLEKELNPGGQPYTMRWVLTLLAYHGTNHFGQLQMIRQHLG